MYIENINSPADVKKLNILQLNVLAEEMRHALLTRASRHGGHFGPNFGMVEAIIAMHYVFDSPKDKIVFDVSHQCYPHKMLTGRKDAYLYEEHYDDVSGYTNPDESEHDFFTVGHTSTSISLACGLAKARDLNGEDGNVIAVIGDGSLSGGEALEGLDFASELNSNMIIVANDNDMSIAENHGGLYGNLKLLRETNGQAECNLFKAMNLDYIYVDKGNDIASLIEAFEKVKDTKKAVVVHINTLKGKGYAPAEQNKEKWHWHMPFDIATGESLFKDEEPDFSDASLEYLLKKMDEDKSVVAITAGTPTVMGFTADMRAKAGKQFVNVGIAEETAVALASGIAANGGKPVFGVYSSFIQRAYDQITQDVCINGNAVTFAVFAGSVYGMNDVTHLGLQDIPMLNSIPGLIYLAPVTKEDYIAMLDWSLTQNAYPVAIKVPGGSMVSTGTPVTKDFGKLDTYEITKTGSRVAILGLGTFYENAVKAADILKSSHGIDATVINPYYISGIDADTLNELKKDHAVVATLEDGYLEGGFGAKIAAYYGSSDMKVLNFGIKKEFIDRYNVAEVLKDNHLTPEQIAEDIAAIL